MPFYDLKCPHCDKEYNISATMSDKTEKRILCPDCGSTDLETVYKAAPWVSKSMRTPECPNSHRCGVGCPHVS